MLQNRSSRPEVQAEVTVGMRWMLYIASFLVLSVGLSLYLLSGQTDRYFAWTIDPPLTAAFLGGSYLSSFFLEFLSARENYWARARIAVPAVWIFTTLTLIITLIHLELFHFGSPVFITQLGTWVWVGVYLTVPIMLGTLWVMQVRRHIADRPREAVLPSWFRLILIVQAALFILIGLGMLLATATLMPAWPWPLKPLAARAIGAWGIGIGVVAAHSAWENSWERLWPTMVSYLFFGLLQLLNIVRYPAELDMSRPVSIFYIALMLTVLLAGLYGSWMARPK